MSTVHKNFAFIVLGVLILTVSACSSPAAAPAAEDTAAPAATAELPTATASPQPPTATPAPTATQAPTATPSATPVTPSFSAWCLPKEVLVPAGSMEQPWLMPEGALAATEVDGNLQLTVPDRFCTVVYTFSQPLPTGAMLKIYDNNAVSWLEAELKPVEGDPNSAYAVLDHSYIVDPPYWQISYRFAVQSPDGQELRSDTLVFDKGWRPDLCWNGALPNPVTLRCIKQEDLHPWDIGYKTVFPTAVEE
jgi:hypothetical protein